MTLSYASKGLEATEMQTKRYAYRVDRRQISFIRFILEAYEGVAVVSTLDGAAGLIVVAVAPGCEILVQDVMTELARTFMIQPCQEQE